MLEGWGDFMKFHKLLPASRTEVQTANNQHGIGKKLKLTKAGIRHCFQKW